MDLRALFRLPAGSGIATFAEAQVQLYRQNAKLQDYFLPLQMNFGRHCTAGVPRRSVSRRFLDLAQAGTYEVVRHTAMRKYKADVLYCPTPYYSRRAENNFLVRTVMALAQTDATVLCLLPGAAPFRTELESRLEAAGRSSQVTLLDPLAALNPIANRLRTRVARDRGRAAFAEIRQALEPLDIDPPQDSLSDYENIAQFVEAWRSLEHLIEFDAVVARCHWLGLCSPVCRTALERGKPVITFQQGVIDHTLDVPISASHYVAFGNSSATLLARMNQLFFQAVGKDEPPVSFVPGGSHFDTILDLPNQFANCTILAIDGPDPNGFYGLDVQRRGGTRRAVGHGDHTIHRCDQ